MELNELKPGDVVYLNSGSPALTVEKITDEGLVKVTYFNGGQQYAFFWPSNLTANKAAHGQR
jgi:uncharacterized protein YodC (DUF2158 family)